MKSFKSNAWMLPPPVLIIGTYDKDGRPNAMNAAWGGQWGNTPDKMQKTGWTIEKAPNVNAPLFRDFPMTLECRVKQKLDESETGCYLIAEIVNILCDELYLDEDGKPNVESMDLITYDPVHHNYIKLGNIEGKAFSDGKQLNG